MPVLVSGHTLAFIVYDSSRTSDGVHLFGVDVVSGAGGGGGDTRYQENKY